MSDVEVRIAGPGDFEHCLALDHASETSQVWQMVLDQNEDDLSIAFRPARLPRVMRFAYPRLGESLLQSWEQQVCFLVAEQAGQIVGYANARSEADQSICRMVDLVVDRPLRQGGIGSALLRGMRQWARDHAFRRMLTEAQTKNYPAIRFYRKHGLVFCGYNDHYYLNNDIAVFFSLSLR